MKPVETDRQAKQKETDKLIGEKTWLKSNIITNFIAYITGTIGGPIISFFKKNGFAIAEYISLVLFFYLKLVKHSWEECRLFFIKRLVSLKDKLQFIQKDLVG